MDPAAYALHADVEERHFWFRGRRAVVSRVIAGLGLRHGARVVELGAGTGGNLPMLERLGDVVAIEPDDAARSIAHGRSPDVTFLASLDGLSGRAFDAAFAFDVLEHLDDPAADLRRLHAWMVPGAPLVVTVPAHPALFGAHDEYLHHRRRYTAALLREHLRDGRFDVEHVTPINAAMLPVAVGLRAIEAARSLVRRPAPAPRGMSLPPSPLNALLASVFGAERHVVERGLPFGLSLLAIARAGGGS
jgi:SAM-dependent methyltransferase